MRLDGGATRTVILTRNWAIKIPGVWRHHPRHWWRGLLLGLLANQQEVEFSACGWPELCPVEFSLWGGWMVVMRRLEVLTNEEFEAHLADAKRRGFRLDRRLDGKGTCLPVELKADGWAWDGSFVVAIDYGGGGRGGRARRPGMSESE